MIPYKDENPAGLYQKYVVLHSDGSVGDRNAEYFILRLDSAGKDPIHVAACRKAVLVYAEAIKDHLPKLAQDLIDRYSDER